MDSSQSEVMRLYMNIRCCKSVKQKIITGWNNNSREAFNLSPNNRHYEQVEQSCEGKCK